MFHPRVLNCLGCQLVIDEKFSSRRLDFPICLSDSERHFQVVYLRNRFELNDRKENKYQIRQQIEADQQHETIWGRYEVFSHCGSDCNSANEGQH
jgi:hypothetical protein